MAVKSATPPSGERESVEQVLTDDSALVRLLGGDNRLAAVVIGGICLAVAAALCTLIVEPITAESSMRSEDPAAGENRRSDRARAGGARRRHATEDAREGRGGS